MPKITCVSGTIRTGIPSSYFAVENACRKLCMNCPDMKKCHAEQTYCKEYEEAVGRYKIGEPKYIRVKDRICKVNYKYFSREKPRYKCVDLLYAYEEDEILKKADTIEELCDNFVGTFKSGLLKRISKNMWLLKDCEIIYGAIWTDKGLIFVAKMNDEGELELL